MTTLAEIPGIGPKTIEALNRLNIYKPQDLLWHFPINLVNRKVFPEIKNANTGDLVILKLVVKHFDIINHRFTPSRRVPYKIRCIKDTEQIDLVFFNYIPHYLLKSLKPGSEIIVSGKIDIFAGRKQIAHPSISQHHTTAEFSAHEAVYPLTYAILNKQISKYISYLLSRLQNIEEWIPRKIMDEFGWNSHKESLMKIHHPENDEDLSPMSRFRTRIAYDQLLAVQLITHMLRFSKKDQLGRSIKASYNYIDKLIEILPFELTIDQKNAIEEITIDLSSNNKMSRLLQGDVGSGKTIVALAAMLHVAGSGVQSVLMAPTDVLANQHFKGFTKLLENLSVRVALLTGNTKISERRKILENLSSGEIDILIGTHAVFQDKVIFKDLGLVVIDEQHKFGVEQRMKLVNKGDKVNLLIMSATPIPRSLSLALYGDMEITKISQKPKSRIPINTSIIPHSNIENLIVKVANILQEGGKIYWICPAIHSQIDESQQQNNQKTAAEARFESLNKIYPGIVGLVHGQLENKQKDENLTKFVEGSFKILVATTVVEVGVDVPDATVIIIENAESFGLAQLHQLRGRVGRGDKASNCILLYKYPISDTALQRLKILKNSNDGFHLAEEDLKLRGSGNLIGTKQSGLPQFKAADFLSHYHLISLADAQAKEIIKNDPHLELPENNKFRRLLALFDLDVEENSSIIN